MVGSQQRAHADLVRSVLTVLQPSEQTVLGNKALVGEIPRLDVIARFLGEDKSAITEFSVKKSGQPTVDACITAIRNVVTDRITRYNGN